MRNGGRRTRKPSRPFAVDEAVPDWAPFAVPDEESWRDVQRRRHLIRMTSELAQLARDEGFEACHLLLSSTADRLRQLLMASSPPEHAPQDRAAGQTAKPARRRAPGNERGE